MTRINTSCTMITVQSSQWAPVTIDQHQIKCMLKVSLTGQWLSNPSLGQGDSAGSTTVGHPLVFCLQTRQQTNLVGRPGCLQKEPKGDYPSISCFFLFLSFQLLSLSHPPAHNSLLQSFCVDSQYSTLSHLFCCMLFFFFLIHLLRTFLN